MPILYSFYHHGNVRIAVKDEDVLEYRTMEYYRRRYAEEAF